MTYHEAIKFLHGLSWFGARFGLETTRTLAARVGNPQGQLRFIHVAGTNGKGSTCAMLESIYRAAGLRVGLFTSPHLVSFRERIQVNRQLISEADVVWLVAELREQSSEFRLQAVTEPAKAGTPNQCASPTLFEFVTVMALRYFAEQKCDLVIWETGLGGRLDATNIVTPLASVITNIGLDHQQWLGNTLAEIAAEKAGIIKPGVPVITAADQPEVVSVIEATAERLGSPFTQISNRPKFSKVYRASLVGEHQQANARLAVATVEVLQKQIPVSDKQIRAGLAAVNWLGRMQVVSRPGGQKILLDGAHNPPGVDALALALQTVFPNAKLTMILGMLADKDWRLMCGRLTSFASRVLTVPVASERTVSSAELAGACSQKQPLATVECSSLAEALQKAAGDPFVVVTGSLYLVGEALELLGCGPEGVTSERRLNEWTAGVQRPDGGVIR